MEGAIITVLSDSKKGAFSVTDMKAPTCPRGRVAAATLPHLSEPLPLFIPVLSVMNRVITASEN